MIPLSEAIGPSVLRKPRASGDDPTARLLEASRQW